MKKLIIAPIRFSIPAILLPLLVVIILCSCATQFDKMISRYYNHELPVLDKKKKNEIQVHPAASNMPAGISLTQPQKIHFVPIVLYWKWDGKRLTTLNSTIPSVYFTNTASSYTNKRLLDKIAGKKLELSIDKTPVSFILNDKERMIFPLFGWQQLWFSPDQNNLVVSYKLSSGGNIEKSGTVEVKSIFSSQPLHYLESGRKAIAKYLDDFEANMKIMSKDIMNKLADEL